MENTEGLLFNIGFAVPACFVIIAMVGLFVMAGALGQWGP